MSRLITFPEGLKATDNWLFEMNGVTNEKDSRGGNQDRDTVATNEFDAEKGSTHIKSEGVAVHRSLNSGWKMSFAQSIDKSRYFSSYCGYSPKNSTALKTKKYSPLYDGICNGFTFKYKKYDGASAKGDTKNRYRVVKFLISYRSADTSYILRDCAFTGGNYYNLTNFINGSQEGAGKDGVFTGEVTCSMPTIAQPVGIICQLQTEGGAFAQSGSYIIIYDLKFSSTKSNEAIMMPFDTYDSVSIPSPRPVWTTG
jgi:hypothetical protein